MTLLDHVRTLVEAERGLTEALEKSTPLLSRNTQNPSPSPFSSSVLTSQSPLPLLPTPRNMQEVQTILAVARAYSLRTSAPSGWNPTLPVIGFATPNPLPHQLRQGALGAMQLKMVREERTRKSKEIQERQEKERRKKMEEEERKRRKEKEEAEKGQDSVTNAMDVDGGEDYGTGTGAGKRKRKDEGRPVEIDPKKREMVERQKRQMAQMAANGQMAGSAGGGGNSTRQSVEELKVKKEAANMNLSDSSSSEEESSSSDDE